MPTLRENLKDHPIQSLLTALASIATILGFIWALSSQSCSKEKKTNEIVLNDTINLKPTLIEQTVSSLEQINDDNSTNENSTPSDQEIKTDNTQQIKSNVNANYDLENFTYCSMNMGCVYYIKFYDFDGMKYKFIAYESAYNFHGTAKVKGLKITIYNRFGNSELFLSNEGRYLTGSLWNEHGTEMSLNYQFGTKD